MEGPDREHAGGIGHGQAPCYRIWIPERNEETRPATTHSGASSPVLRSVSGWLGGYGPHRGPRAANDGRHLMSRPLSSSGRVQRQLCLGNMRRKNSRSAKNPVDRTGGRKSSNGAPVTRARSRLSRGLCLAGRASSALPAAGDCRLRLWHTWRARVFWGAVAEVAESGRTTA